VLRPDCIHGIDESSDAKYLKEFFHDDWKFVINYGRWLCKDPLNK
jgi:hypothetical protein